MGCTRLAAVNNRVMSPDGILDWSVGAFENHGSVGRMAVLGEPHLAVQFRSGVGEIEAHRAGTQSHFEGHVITVYFPRRDWHLV